LTTQNEISTATRVLSGPVKVHVVDPSAYTPAYDHALCAALARGGVDVELHTTRFPYGELPDPAGYLRCEDFYAWAPGRPGSGSRRAAKLAGHVPGMLAYRRLASGADVVHFQWLAVPQLDRLLLPRGRPLVLTAHDVLPREGSPAHRDAQRRSFERFDALIAHSEHGRERLLALGVAPQRVRVIPHGAFAHLAALPAAPLPPELPDPGSRHVVLCFGLLRPYKGLDVLVDAWREIGDAELWIVGRPRFDVASLRARSPATVRWVPRYVTELELAACLRRAEIVVAPYREIEQSGVVATALAFGSPLILSDVGGFREVAAAGAARLVPPGDAAALRGTLRDLLADAPARAQLAGAARALAAGEWSWDRVAGRTRSLYEELLS
jgi:glycosyltransferase involved in cell wall biosynthesis